MNVQEILDRARDAVTTNRVYGEPIRENGVTIIPAAKIGGGGGGGEGAQPEEKGHGLGAGLGMSAHPTGAFVVRDGTVTWQPAIDVNRAILAGAAASVAALLVLRTIIRMLVKSRRI
ncbi:spore germination protein GerW family protein [Gandjariella thermophila]|uniref:Sporulation protein YtfJ n=1 Tax=Gandjariella thermophila TaxID=1931992 RepID=A0A4D4J5T4_9PSEU|nr:spore germination protein GerW family protein [Gandjariella thermophila]GDY31911.1 hypothetical protein GTS_35440 [Gandjariella thermophila]